MVDGIINIIENIGCECDNLVKETKVKYGLGGLVFSGVTISCVYLYLHQKEKKEIKQEHQKQIEILEEQLHTLEKNYMHENVNDLVLEECCVL